MNDRIITCVGSPPYSSRAQESANVSQDYAAKLTVAIDYSLATATASLRFANYAATTFESASHSKSSGINPFMNGSIPGQVRRQRASIMQAIPHRVPTSANRESLIRDPWLAGTVSSIPK